MHVSALPKKCWHHMTRGLLHLVVISGWTQTSLTCWRFGVNWLRGSSPFHAPETASQPPFFFILQKHNSLNNISLLLCVANLNEAATFISSEHQNKPAHCKSSVASSVVQAVKSHCVNEDTTGVTQVFVDKVNVSLGIYSWFVIVPANEKFGQQFRQRQFKQGVQGRQKNSLNSNSYALRVSPWM